MARRSFSAGGHLGVARLLVAAVVVVLSQLGTPVATHAFFSTGDGTWVWQNPLPQGNTLAAVSCPSTTTCFAVGRSGTILSTSNGGGAWTVQSSGTTNGLSGVSCPTTSSCIAVGGYGTILSTSNGGGTWTAQSSGTTNGLTGISCPSTTTCFAVGSYGTILNTSNGGGTWTVQSSGTIDDLRGVSCPSTTTCFAVGGGSSATILSTGNGGGTWTRQSLGATNPLMGVSCPSTTTCFAVGYSGTILGTSNGGSTWPAQSSGTTAELDGVSCPNTTTCFVVGNVIGGNSTILATSNGGGTWTAGGGYGFNWGVNCPSSTTCFAVGLNGAVISTNNGGGTWTVQSSSTTFAYLFGVSCASTTSCFAVGSYGTIVSGSNGGGTWTAQSYGTINTLNGVSCPSTTTCFAVGNSGTILGTSNGGGTWTPQSSGTTNGISDISCPSTTTCFAVGNSGTILGTSNGGGTWTPQSSGTTNGLSGISCPSTTTCFAVGNSGTILGTSNGGGTWTSQSSGTTAELDGVSCPNTTTCFAVNGGAHCGCGGASAPRGGIILATSDGGSTWTVQSSGTTTAISGVSCPSTSTCFAVGAGGAILAKGGASGVVPPSSSVSNTTRSSYSLNVQQPDRASTWYEVDPSLRTTVTVATGQAAVIGGNMDLWTGAAGYNQDIGIFKTDCSLGNLLAWKESGGFAGTLSPNAAFVQTVVTTPGAYTFTLCWKANKVAPAGTVYGAAGTSDTYFSPTGLTVKVVPAANLVSAATTNSYSLTTQQPDRASTWYEVDPALRVQYTATASGSLLMSANMDLWTAASGYNQDFAIFSGANCGNLANLVSWKESGGFAGTLSPNAAFVEGTVPVSAGQAYSFTLCWKANKVAPAGTVYGAAGTADTYFSPTRLTAEFVPAANFASASTLASYHLDLQQPDRASTWYEVDPGLHVMVNGSASQTVVLGGNMDLWTAAPGYNQDLAIFLGTDCTNLANLLAWKESGGFAGTLSPNAAFVQARYVLATSGTTTFTLCWKANKVAPAGTIYGAAGTADTYFSPTRLTAELTN